MHIYLSENIHENGKLNMKKIHNSKKYLPINIIYENGSVWDKDNFKDFKSNEFTPFENIVKSTLQNSM